MAVEVREPDVVREHRSAPTEQHVERSEVVVAVPERENHIVVPSDERFDALEGPDVAGWANPFEVRWRPARPSSSRGPPCRTATIRSINFALYPATPVPAGGSGETNAILRRGRREERRSAFGGATSTRALNASMLLPATSSQRSMGRSGSESPTAPSRADAITEAIEATSIGSNRPSGGMYSLTGGRSDAITRALVTYASMTGRPRPSASDAKQTSSAPWKHASWISSVRYPATVTQPSAPAP